MRHNLKSVFLLLLMMPVCGQVISAQGSLLKKMKEKAEEEVVRGVFGDRNKSDETGTTAQPGYEQTSSETSPGNTRGAGLTRTAPNVPDNIASAGGAFGKGDYPAARYAVRQAILSSVNLYMAGAGSYASNEDTGQKQVTFKGYPGMLAYDEGSGYTLSVPFGQSSVFVAEGINFADEQEIMAAAEEFDLEKIKKELGEQ